MIVLGIETSCDDTSLALFSPERGVLVNLTAAQVVHGRYGGVVPEVASREHVRTILPVFNETLGRAGLGREDIGGIGVSNGPGLIGSLLVGAGFAKALAFALEVPLVGIHHIEAHIFSNEICGEPLFYPCIALVVSGGHTCLYLAEHMGCYELIGSTRDDAAGEAFDKIAKLLGMGYPGGPAIEEAALSGEKEAIRFPRAMMTKGNFDFSFSGLKTAVRLYAAGVERLDSKTISNIAASAQEAIVDALAQKTITCAREYRVPHLYLAGGVAANQALRNRLKGACEREGITYHAPLVRYCTDNGAMVACAAFRHVSMGRNDGPSLDVFARGPVLSWN